MEDNKIPFEVIDQYIQKLAAQYDFDTKTFKKNIENFKFCLRQIGKKFKESRILYIDNSNIYNIYNSELLNYELVCNYYIDIFKDLTSRYNITGNLYLYSEFLGLNKNSLMSIIEQGFNNNRIKSNPIYLYNIKSLQEAADDTSETVIYNTDQIVGHIKISNDRALKQAMGQDAVLNLDNLPNFGLLGGDSNQNIIDVD